MDSLSDRLKSLGFKTASTVSKPEEKKHIPLEAAIDGVVIENSAGAFVLKEQSYPFNYQHGNVKFVSEIATGSINQTARIEASPNSLERMLFIDTETSGLSGGAGTFAFLIGIGRFQQEGFNLKQFIIRDPGEELAMLLHMANMIQDDTIFVSFNGKSFDIPLIQNRLVINRLPMHLREMAHLDILHISRKLWRRQLPSCTLKDLETAILDFPRTSEDVPGWMIPDIYFEYLRTGNPSKLSDVIYHNAQDIVSLAALFIHISRLLETNTTYKSISTNDLIAISRVYWDMGSHEIAVKTLKICAERKLSADQSRMVYSMLGGYQKLHRNFNEAIKNWKIAANEGDPHSCIQLAMYYEHKRRDIPTALKWSKKCISLIENQQSKLSVNDGFKLELEKRILRLQMKESRNV